MEKRLKKQETINARLRLDVYNIVKKHSQFNESISDTLMRIMKEGLEYDPKRTKGKNPAKNAS